MKRFTKLTVITVIACVSMFSFVFPALGASNCYANPTAVANLINSANCNEQILNYISNCNIPNAPVNNATAPTANLTNAQAQLVNMINQKLNCKGLQPQSVNSILNALAQQQGRCK